MKIIGRIVHSNTWWKILKNVDCSIFKSGLIISTVKIVNMDRSNTKSRTFFDIVYT